MTEEKGIPAFAGMTSKDSKYSWDLCFRRDDNPFAGMTEEKGIPAFAGMTEEKGIPAFAGMTEEI